MVGNEEREKDKEEMKEVEGMECMFFGSKQEKKRKKTRSQEKRKREKMQRKREKSGKEKKR